MATTPLSDRGRVEAPISIYFGLEQGKKPNLEVVAEAAIAWVAAVREMAAVVDPSLDVRVEILDGDEGSLWLNTLTAIESKLERIEAGGEKFPRLWALAKGFAYIVVGTPLAVGAEDIYRAVIHDDPAIVGKLSEEGRQELIEDFRKALREDVARPQKQKVFRATQKDQAITSLGASSIPRGEPRIAAPREEFVRYAQASATVEIAENRRKRSETWEVTLISPVLENSERSWRFVRAGLPEFGAIMRDKGFLSAIEYGGIHVELRKGIQMVVEIQFTERLEGDVWRTLERGVLRVIEPGYDRGELFDRPAT